MDFVCEIGWKCDDFVFRHIKEDLGDWARDLDDNMTEKEMEFYYFKWELLKKRYILFENRWKYGFFYRIHDSDNNSKLDGLELLQAIQHILPEVELDPNNGDSNPDSHRHKPNRNENFLDLDQYESKLSLEREKEEDLTYFAGLITFWLNYSLPHY